jgi:predicted nucleic acid-binding Zn ribbon protein
VERVLERNPGTDRNPENARCNLLVRNRNQAREADRTSASVVRPEVAQRSTPGQPLPTAPRLKTKPSRHVSNVAIA